MRSKRYKDFFNMPIPYLGSKRRLSKTIYLTIKNLNPNANVLVDLFCGGFAVGEYFLKMGWKVIANDKNKYVIALLKKIFFEGLEKEKDKIFKFISREEFFRVINNPSDYDDWWVGFVMCIWSFENNQRAYLYSKELEPIKKTVHEIVINKNPEPIKKIFPNLPLDKTLSLNDYNKRRVILNKIQRLQHIERLNQLFNIDKWEGDKDRIKFYSLDYKDVSFPKGKNVVIYCDPPYAETAEYKVDKFNHQEFWQWVREKSKTYKIYVSEYQAPSDFKKVFRASLNVHLQGRAKKPKFNECLFVKENEK